MEPNVIFDEQTTRTSGSQNTFLVRLVKKSGLATNQRDVQIVLAGIALLAGLAAVAIFMLSPGIEKAPSDSDRTIIEKSTPLAPAPTMRR